MSGRPRLGSDVSSSWEAEDARIDQLRGSPLGLYLQCSLSDAPGCFRTVLVRSLELAEGNFIPTNWRGFSEHFGLRELRARSAEELVDKWANRHPYRREHTLRKVVDYARSKDHRKLLDSFVHTLRGESQLYLSFCLLWRYTQLM